ncbi:MAG: nucleoside 2-deoxyribosyltransferase domain-containing protein [Methanobrevibacter sp.]|nr:nucleoside 2-deoxyribosyltransferase domain-containing protein [Methanobrevibacter sp.]
MKVFLGGTINGSRWRDELIAKLKIDYFNPVVDDWDENAQLIEEREKESSDFLLFVLTPLMKCVFSVAEVVDASNKTPEKTIFCVLDSDGGLSWDEDQIKAFDAVSRMVESNGALVFDSLDEIAEYLNDKSLL